MNAALNHHLTQDRLYLFASAFLFALFAFLVINHSLFFTMDGDEAYNSTTAKNWLAGYGYSSSIGVIFPFDPYISSGPGYTLLLAIPLYLFGIDPDIPKPFISMVHLFLLGTAFWLMRPHIKTPRHFFWTVASCLTIFCIVEFKFWHRSAGELLSLLYFVNALLLMATGCRTLSLRHGIAGGLLAALALLTKQQALLFIAGLLVASMISLSSSFAKRHPKNNHSLRYLIFIATATAAFTIPCAAWSHYKMQALAELSRKDPHLYEYYLGKDWHFFSTHGSGLNLLWETHSLQDFLKREIGLALLAFGKFSSAFSRMADYNVIGGTCTILFSILSFLISIRQFRKTDDPLLFFFCLPVMAFLTWALFLNNSIFMHQMLPGIWLTIFASAITFSRYPRLLTALTIGAASVTLGTANKFGEHACFDPNNATCVYQKENPIRISFNHVLDYLKSHELPAPPANCGWYFAQDVEYALPGVNNIQDCMRLFDEALIFDKDAFITTNKLPEEFRQSKTSEEMQFLFVNKRKNLFGASFVAPVIWKQPLEFTYIASIHTMGESLEHKRNVMSFLDHCKESLYEDSFYIIRICRYEDLQAYVTEWHGLPIFTHQWESVYYRDFMRQTKQ